MAKKVTATGKDDDGDIIKLCGGTWSVTKAEAIQETLDAGNGHNGAATPYYVEVDGAVVNVRVYTRTESDGSTTQYLRTEADSTTANNLTELDDC